MELRSVIKKNDCTYSDFSCFVCLSGNCPITGRNWRTGPKACVCQRRRAFHPLPVKFALFRAFFGYNLLFFVQFDSFFLLSKIEMNEYKKRPLRKEGPGFFLIYRVKKIRLPVAYSPDPIAEHVVPLGSCWSKARGRLHGSRMLRLQKREHHYE